MMAVYYVTVMSPELVLITKYGRTKVLAGGGLVGWVMTVDKEHWQLKGKTI